MLVAAIVLIARRPAARSAASRRSATSSRARRGSSRRSGTPGIDADSLADAPARALGYRVTLIDSDGRVVGDSEFGPRRATPAGEPLDAPGDRRGARARHRRVAARTARRPATTSCTSRMRHPLGLRARLAHHARDSTRSCAARSATCSSSGLVALRRRAGARVAVRAERLAARRRAARRRARASPPATSSRRPALSAPGEVGDLATALHRMAEQLAHAPRRARGGRRCS